MLKNTITYQNVLWILAISLCASLQTSVWPHFFSIPAPQLWLICIFFLCRTKSSQELIFFVPLSSLFLSQFTSFPTVGIFVALAVACGVLVAVRDNSYLTSRWQIFWAIFLFSFGLEGLFSALDLVMYRSILVSNFFEKIFQSALTSFFGIWLLPILERAHHPQQFDAQYE